MLAAARTALDGRPVELRTGRLEDALPARARSTSSSPPSPSTTSTATGKADLFARVARRARARAGGSRSPTSSCPEDPRRRRRPAVARLRPPEPARRPARVAARGRLRAHRHLARAGPRRDRRRPPVGTNTLRACPAPSRPARRRRRPLRRGPARRSRRPARRSAGIDDPSTRTSAARWRRERFDVVCVVARQDALPLRLALLVRHLDEDVPLVVTVFDRDMAAQLEDVVPHLRVTSLADIVAPALAGPCIDDDLEAIRRADDGGLDGGPRRRRASRSSPQQDLGRCARSCTAVFTPYDRSARLMFYGAMGLVVMLAFETVRRDDRARPGLRRRPLRLDQVARHGRARTTPSPRARRGSRS